MSFQMTANKGGGGPSEQPPAGTHPAVLVALADLGTQHEEFGGEAKWQRQALLVWELPTKKRKDGKPFLMDAVVTLSLNEKAKLRKWAEAMTDAKIPDGAAFDVTTLVGKACMVGVQHNEKGYAKVTSVTGFPDMGIPAPPASTPSFVCSLEEFQGSKKPVPEWLPWQWSRALGQRVSVPDYIRASKEIAGDGARKPQAAPQGEAGIPF